MALINGDDFVSGSILSYQEENRIKNHWRLNIANLTNPSEGMIKSTPVTNLLEHCIADSTPGPIVWAEIVQGDIPLTDNVAVIVGSNSDGLIYYDEAGLDEVMIEARAHADTEGITISLLETNQRFRIRQNADYMSMYLDGADAFFTWSDGTLNLQTDEPDTNAIVNIRGQGTGAGILRVFDEDEAEWIQFQASAQAGYLKVDGAAPAVLNIQYEMPQSIICWGGIPSGNPVLRIHGWITAGGARRYGQFRMDDNNDEFEIEAENNANHEGITVLIQEANQRFRVRGAARAQRFWIDEDGLVGWTRVGELLQWTYQGDLADDASFNLPAFTDACWGMIQAGDNEEYALFSVDDVGNVTLISNSANVVANANTDGKLCLGIASPEEPLTIRNRLDATKNINLIIWYS